MITLGSLLICGLSSGEIAIIKVDKCEMETIKVHDKPVRMI